MKGRSIVSLLLIAGLIGPGFAQQSPVTLLTFKEAVKLGLQNNVALNQQKNQLEYTQVNKTSSLLQMGPTVSASGSLYRADGNSFNQQEGKVVNGVIDYVNGSIDANMPVFSGLSFLNQFRSAKSANEAQLHQVVRSNQDVIALVSTQYLACLLDRELIKVNAENVKTQQATYEQIKGQASLGAKAEADQYTQEYQLKNAELLLVRAQNQLKNDMATMGVTIGIDPASFEIGDVDWDINALAADTTPIEEMYSTASTRRSDLKQATLAEKAFKYNYSATKGRYFPSIYAGASYGSRYNYIQGETNRTFDEQFRKDNTNFGYGLSINIPIWNAFQTKAQSAQAKVSYKNASVRRKNTEVQVKSDVLRAYQNFNDAKIGYAAAQSGMKASEMSYQMEKERYDLGISNIVQLAVVNQAYVKAQGDFSTAKFNLMFQKLFISYSMGTLQFEDIP